MRRGHERAQRNADWFDDDFKQRSGEVVERNGNLTLVRDAETGEETWVAGFQIERRY